jgi:hypothetical protein
VKALLREITNVPEMFDRSAVKSSVRPSAKYCWSRSSLRLANGSTTIERRGTVVGIAGADADAVTVGDAFDKGHSHHMPPATTRTPAKAAAATCWRAVCRAADRGGSGISALGRAATASDDSE